MTFILSKQIKLLNLMHNRITYGIKVKEESKKLFHHHQVLHQALNTLSRKEPKLISMVQNMKKKSNIRMMKVMKKMKILI